MPNNDLISRKALVEHLSTIHMDDVFPNWFAFTLEAKQQIGKLGERFEREILYIPAVDAEPARHGNWEIINRNEAQCLECKMIRNIGDQMGWNYCPNCGAKMR